MNTKHAGLFLLSFLISVLSFCQQADKRVTTASGKAVQGQSKIKWEEEVTINNTPVTKGSRGRYGSEYARLLRIGKRSWLAGYTVARTSQDSRKRARLEIEVARSDDGGRSWRKISFIADTSRDLDNAQLIQLKDGSILLACRSLKIYESYWLPVYRSTDNGVSWNM